MPFDINSILKEVNMVSSEPCTACTGEDLALGMLEKSLGEKISVENRNDACARNSIKLFFRLSKESVLILARDLSEEVYCHNDVVECAKCFIGRGGKICALIQNEKNYDWCKNHKLLSALQEYWNSRVFVHYCADQYGNNLDSNFQIGDRWRLRDEYDRDGRKAHLTDIVAFLRKNSNEMTISNANGITEYANKIDALSCQFSDYWMHGKQAIPGAPRSLRLSIAKHNYHYIIRADGIPGFEFSTPDVCVDIIECIDSIGSIATMMWGEPCEYELRMPNKELGFTNVAQTGLIIWQKGLLL